MYFFSVYLIDFKFNFSLLQYFRMVLKLRSIICLKVKFKLRGILTYIFKVRPFSIRLLFLFD